MAGAVAQKWPHAALVWPWRPLLLSGLLGGERKWTRVAITMTTTDRPPRPALAQGGVSEGPVEGALLTFSGSLLKSLSALIPCSLALHAVCIEQEGSK